VVCFAAYASTNCSGDAIGSTSNKDCFVAGSLAVKVESYLSPGAAFGVMVKQWTGTTECTSNALGAMWTKSFGEGDCVFFTVNQGTLYYRKLTCECSYYGVTLFSDSACSEEYPTAMPDTSLSGTCSSRNEGSAVYPYERAWIMSCNKTALGYCPPPPPPPTGTVAPTVAPTMAPTTLSPTPAPEGKAVVVQATVELNGISSAQFDTEARQAFKTVTALSIGSLCGASGASMCTAEDVTIVGVNSRRASGVSVQFNILVAGPQLLAASQTLTSAVSDGSFMTSLQESNHRLEHVTGMDFAEGGQPAESTVSAPVVRTTVQCFSAKYATVESGGLSPVQLSNFGWSVDVLQGFVEATSSTSSKSTCHIAPGDAPIGCVSYEMVVQATNQSGSNLAYRMQVASCGTTQTCDALRAAAEETLLNADEEDSMTIQNIVGCETCTSDLCNSVAWPSSLGTAEQDTTVGITAYVGIGVGLLVCVIILFFLLRSMGQSCSQHGEPAYKQAEVE